MIFEKYKVGCNANQNLLWNNSCSTPSCYKLQKLMVLPECQVLPGLASLWPIVLNQMLIPASRNWFFYPDYSFFPEILSFSTKITIFCQKFIVLSRCQFLPVIVFPTFLSLKIFNSLSNIFLKLVILHWCWYLHEIGFFYRDAKFCLKLVFLTRIAWNC